MRLMVDQTDNTQPDPPPDHGGSPWFFGTDGLVEKPDADALIAECRLKKLTARSPGDRREQNGNHGVRRIVHSRWTDLGRNWFFRPESVWSITTSIRLKIDFTSVTEVHVKCLCHTLWGASGTG